MMILVFVIASVLVGRALAEKQKSIPSSPPVIESEVCVLQPDLHEAVGTLSDGHGKVLQLFGRPSPYHRGRYNYHCLVDESRIPVELTFRGRRCEERFDWLRTSVYRG